MSWNQQFDETRTYCSWRKQGKNSVQWPLSMTRYFNFLHQSIRIIGQARMSSASFCCLQTIRSLKISRFQDLLDLWENIYAIILAIELKCISTPFPHRRKQSVPTIKNEEGERRRYYIGTQKPVFLKYCSSFGILHYFKMFMPSRSN